MITRKAAVCAILAAASMLALAPASPAGADANCNPDQGACAFRFEHSYAIDTVIPIDGCAAQWGTSGTMVGTGEETDIGTFSNIPGNRFFHYRQFNVENTRIGLAGGYYSLDTFRAEFTYNSGSHPSVLTFTQPIHEQATVYSADGQRVGAVHISGLAHYTWRDMDGNGDPTPGDDFLSFVENLRMNCS